MPLQRKDTSLLSVIQQTFNPCTVRGWLPACHSNGTLRGSGSLEKILSTPGSNTPLSRPQWEPLFPCCDIERQRSVKFRKHMIFIWKSINCENECPCVYLCSTPLSSPEAPFCTPAANLLAPRRNPNSAATSRLFVWLCHYWIETRRPGGCEVRMGTASFWRVHLLNLWPSWMMFRLGRGSKLLTLVLDDHLAGEICIAEILSGLEAKLCILPRPQCWLANSFNGESLNKYGKGQKCLCFRNTEMCMNTSSLNCHHTICVKCHWRAS